MSLFFFLFSFFFFFLFFFFSLFVMTSNMGNYNKRDLLLVSLLILHTFLGRSMLMAKMALLGSMPCPVILRSWAILSLPTLERWVLLPFFLSHFVSVTNPSFFELQCTIQEHEELVWLAGNLKLEVTNYSSELYGPRGVAHPSGGDDDDDDGEEEGSEATPSYWSRKRRHHWLPAVQDIYRHTTPNFFPFFLL